MCTHGENNDVLYCMHEHELNFKEIDQSRCHWVMQLCGETADSCLCGFLGIDPYQSKDVYTFLCTFYGKRIIFNISQ